ncbi:MAG: integrase arm-type DNA-binding domain-containing protein [Gemmatimonadota bacterium]|nr:integrase arm-type DNA-binding domain-containing protein [Gemmatimonadota bacterium]
MPKRLTAAFVKHAAPGRHYDEHGLILRVKPTGSKQWIWRGTIRGRRVDLGLGGYPYTTLAEARQAAFEYKKLARAGGDPRALKTTAPTFEHALEKVLAIHRASWRPGSKSEAQWRASLQTYAFPRIGRKRVDQIGTADVMAVLLPIWSTKRETARRVRQRIGAVMKWAVAQGYREDNPAGDAIGAALPKNGGKVNHFRALPHGQVRAALATVRASEAWVGTKLAFRFLVLTATRSGETRLAKWDEIEGDTWTIPGRRTKSGRPHRVPLAPAAHRVLDEAREIADGSGLLFPSPTGTPLSAATMTKLLRENGVHAVPHGFRTSFRTWCGDTAVAPEVAERALAHAVRDKVQAAYDRGTLFERRRRVMNDWAAYIAGGGDDG